MRAATAAWRGVQAGAHGRERREGWRRDLRVARGSYAGAHWRERGMRRAATHARIANKLFAGAYQRDSAAQLELACRPGAARSFRNVCTCFAFCFPVWSLAAGERGPRADCGRRAPSSGLRFGLRTRWPRHGSSTRIPGIDGTIRRGPMLGWHAVAAGGRRQANAVRELLVVGPTRVPLGRTPSCCRRARAQVAPSRRPAPLNVFGWQPRREPQVSQTGAVRRPRRLAVPSAGQPIAPTLFPSPCFSSQVGPGNE